MSSIVSSSLYKLLTSESDRVFFLGVIRFGKLQHVKRWLLNPRPRIEFVLAMCLLGHAVVVVYVDIGCFGGATAAHRPRDGRGAPRAAI